MADLEPIPADPPDNANVTVAVYWFDGDGNPVDGPRDARTCEIHELDPNGVIKRTYADVN